MTVELATLISVISILIAIATFVIARKKDAVAEVKEDNDSLNSIKEMAGNSDEIIIATDYDREGELIGMETVRAVDVDMSKVRRAKFSAGVMFCVVKRCMLSFSLDLVEKRVP